MTSGDAGLAGLGFEPRVLSGKRPPQGCYRGWRNVLAESGHHEGSPSVSAISGAMTSSPTAPGTVAAGKIGLTAIWDSVQARGTQTPMKWTPVCVNSQNKSHITEKGKGYAAAEKVL